MLLFWVQVHDLPAGFFSEIVGKALADYIGSFVSSDAKNIYSLEIPYMHIKVCLDIWQPLKKGKKVRKSGGDWIVCSFCYEKLPTFILFAV